VGGCRFRTLKAPVTGDDVPPAFMVNIEIQ